MTYLRAYLRKFDDLGVDFHQTKVNKYIYDIFKLFGGQGQRSRSFLIQKLSYLLAYMFKFDYLRVNFY